MESLLALRQAGGELHHGRGAAQSDARAEQCTLCCAGGPQSSVCCRHLPGPLPKWVPPRPRPRRGWRHR